MNEQELRNIVREAIARHASGSLASHVPILPAGRFSVIHQDPSHALFEVPAGADAGGPCVIEPAVTCNHCGYCKSYGH